ncbi:hypothetical protein XCR1_1030012 [Xenorhabdus cabanillasii JM26]|uniref:Uncharacterized protein n=1 Tax=Xenorhabdus cabanillasii JM26 TaxID=1427517 RepID=W1IKU5_9GAMM|nr:hypothetical protein XCR1_1030012 [Xenorhabdus cabanillasii JM26]
MLSRLIADFRFLTREKMIWLLDNNTPQITFVYLWRGNYELI